jgi:predicted anti-sigma-YlaC factor YlaD
MKHERHGMTHATDGLLLAYVDGEIDGSAEAELNEHLAICTACADELRELERLSAHAHGALAVLDAPVPVLRAQATLAAARRANARGAGSRRRLGGTALAKAAMLLLALAGVAAAAIPGSPVRRALETTIARVAQLFDAAPAAEPVVITEVETAVPLTETTSAAIMPADGRVRIVLHPSTGRVDVHVRLVDVSRASVETETTAPEVRLRSAAGRIEVIGLTTGRVRIDIPRQVPSANVEVGGRVYVYKAGERLQLTGPAGDEQGAAVGFRIES